MAPEQHRDRERRERSVRVSVALWGLSGALPFASLDALAGKPTSPRRGAMACAFAVRSKVSQGHPFQRFPSMRAARRVAPRRARPSRRRRSRAFAVVAAIGVGLMRREVCVPGPRASCVWGASRSAVASALASGKPYGRRGRRGRPRQAYASDWPVSRACEATHVRHEQSDSADRRDVSTAVGRSSRRSCRWSGDAVDRAAGAARPARLGSCSDSNAPSPASAAGDPAKRGAGRRDRRRSRGMGRSTRARGSGEPRPWASSCGQEAAYGPTLALALARRARSIGADPLAESTSRGGDRRRHRG
jgi:hypothetical protein